jgi:hypothetical protein
MPYTSPTGGTRTPTPKPGPTVVRVPMYAWRQPTGGLRATGST